MGQYDFTYRLPENFHKRLIQFLQQCSNSNVVTALQRCEYEYDDIGLTYYAGLKGDNWDKKAVDFTFEGTRNDISILKAANSILENAIAKALKPSESGYLLREIIYFESDIPFENSMIPVSNEIRLSCDIKTSNTVRDDLIQIGERICSNCTFNASSSENCINDYFRDMFFAKGYSEVKDQTRHGVSTSGKDAGEVDILLTKEGKEIAIFEGLKLSSINTSYIDKHISKAIVNYNSLGTATFIIAYVNSSDFESFWTNYINHIEQYNFPLQVKKEFRSLPYPNAATRIADMILTRDDYDFPVYFIAFKIC